MKGRKKMSNPTKKFYHFSRAITVGEHYTILAENEDEARAKLEDYEDRGDYDTCIVEKSDYFHLDDVEENEF
jgi:hypothetical protein